VSTPTIPKRLRTRASCGRKGYNVRQRWLAPWSAEGPLGPKIDGDLERAVGEGMSRRRMDCCHSLSLAETAIGRIASCDVVRTCSSWETTNQNLPLGIVTKSSIGIVDAVKPADITTGRVRMVFLRQLLPSAYFLSS
jgi:hypothetical protein